MAKISYEVTAVLTADTSKNPKCLNLRAVADALDQGYPKCYPKPGMTLRIDAAKRIGPPVALPSGKGGSKSNP